MNTVFLDLIKADKKIGKENGGKREKRKTLSSLE